MKISLTAIVICMFLFFSCANEKKADNSVPSASSSAPLEAAAPDLNQPTFIVPDGLPGANPSSSAANTPTATVAAGINPAHGQPGHRCDIAVGAPLNSAPTNAGAPSAGTTIPIGTVPPAPPQFSQPPLGSQAAANAASAPPSSVLRVPSTTATKTAPGMNPPHGQPGHDCAIAVGAPLKK